MKIEIEDTEYTDEKAKTMNANELRMSGENARIIIENSHALLRHKFRTAPLWSMVGQITGHGSGYSIEICKSAKLDPMQPCARKELQDWSAPSV